MLGEYESKVTHEAALTSKWCGGTLFANLTGANCVRFSNLRNVVVPRGKRENLLLFVFWETQCDPHVSIDP